MNKEFIEKQLKLSKRQNKDERYDYLCSEFNGINYCINLEKYTNKLQQENKQLKDKLEFYSGLELDKTIDKTRLEYNKLLRENKKYKEVINKAINNSQYWIDYYTRLNSDERIALRLQENIDILKEVK